jgi:hypothetical protein
MRAELDGIHHDDDMVSRNLDVKFEAFNWVSASGGWER